MKAIQVDNEFIIREQGHSVNRDANEFQLQLSLEPKFGVQLSASHRPKMASTTWYFSGADYPALWAENRNASNFDLMDGFLDLINEYFALKKQEAQRDENPITREVVYDGNTAYYRDEDEQAFLAAVERTAHEPQMQDQGNEFTQKVRDFLDKETALNQIEQFLDHIEAHFDVSEPFVLADI